MECKRFGICSLFSLHNVLLIQEWYIALFIIFYTGYFKHCVFRASALISVFQSRISKAYLSGIRLLKKKIPTPCCVFNNVIKRFYTGIWDECVKKLQTNAFCACHLFCISLSIFYEEVQCYM